MYPVLDEAGTLNRAIAVVRNVESLCRTALWWLIKDGQIVDERRFVGVRTASACDPAELKSGWWTKLSFPTPLDQRLSDEIEIGGQTIALFNSDEDRRALVEWVSGRFAIGGLALPVVDQIVFRAERPMRRFCWSGKSYVGVLGGVCLYR